MAVNYTFLEVESIERDYDEQVPLKVIAENVNREYHNNEDVRTRKSISYVIERLNNDSSWKGRLEEKWMSELEAKF